MCVCVPSFGKSGNDKLVKYSDLMTHTHPPFYPTRPLNQPHRSIFNLSPSGNCYEVRLFIYFSSAHCCSSFRIFFSAFFALWAENYYAWQPTSAFGTALDG